MRALLIALLAALVLNLLPCILAGSVSGIQLDSNMFYMAETTQPLQFTIRVPPNYLSTDLMYNLTGSVTAHTPLTMTIQYQGAKIDSTDVSNLSAIYSLQASGTTKFSFPTGLWSARPGFTILVTFSSANISGANLELTKLWSRPKVGMFQDNMVWSSQAANTKTVNGIVKIPAYWLRTDIRTVNNIGTFVAIVQSAQNVGMQVLGVIDTDPSDYNNAQAATVDPGQPFTDGCGWPGGQLQLSKTNVTLYSNRLRAYLVALKAANLKLGALEIWNEWDWKCFNADVNFSGYGQNSAQPVFREFAATLSSVITSTSQLVATYMPGTPIIMGGAANCWLFTTQGCLQDPWNVLSGLQPSVLSLLSGYGLHAYVDDPTNVIQRWNSMTINHPKPYWITEFGWQNTDVYGRIRGYLESINNGLANIPVCTQMVYYDGSGYSLSNANGTLLPSARALTQYYDLKWP